KAHGPRLVRQHAGGQCRLVELAGQGGPGLAAGPPGLVATTCHGQHQDRRAKPPYKPPLPHACHLLRIRGQSRPAPGRPCQSRPPALPEPAMASSLLALLDDITTVLDDVSVMTKVATKKTAGVLGDDLALNAHQVTGVKPDRELPVVWAVAKGSLVNKAILVPAALAISALETWLQS